RRSKLSREKWEQRSDYREATIKQACQFVTDVYDPHAVILDPSDPLRSAREFVKRRHTVNGIRSLQHQRGVFYAFDPAISAYSEMDHDSVRAVVYEFLDAARVCEDTDQGTTLKPFKPTKTKVESVIDALRAVCNLAVSELPPSWLADAPPGLAAIDIV